MANLDRALVAVSNNLGMLANNAANREHERVMAMRQENFMRLQHMLGEESRGLDRAARKEELATEGQMRRDLFKEETQARREMFQEESAARRSEGQADRASRERIAGMEIGAQQQRYEREDIRAYDAQYLSRTNALDKRIQELNDYKVQAQAEGKLVDNSYLTQIDQELSQLGEQKRSLSQERDLMLARGGDSRYRKLSPEEVAALKKQGQGPGSGGAREDMMPMAAQGPQEPGRGGSSIKVPQAPPKPAGMQAREERRRPPERQAAAGGGELALGNWEEATGEPPPSRRRQIAAGEGARDLVQLVKGAGEAMDARRNEGPLVKEVKAALAAGRKPDQTQLQALSRIDRGRLTQVFDFTESQLKAMGL